MDEKQGKNMHSGLGLMYIETRSLTLDQSYSPPLAYKSWTNSHAKYISSIMALALMAKLIVALLLNKYTATSYEIPTQPIKPQIPNHNELSSPRMPSAGNENTNN